MEWFHVLLALFGGGIAYKLTQPYRFKVLQNLEGHHSRLANNPISPDSHKAAGVDLIRSGHPDENIMRAANRRPMTLKQIHHQTANDLQKNRSVLSSNHFNDQVNRKKTYAHVNSDVGFPQLNMASGWYAKSVAAPQMRQTGYFQTGNNKNVGVPDPFPEDEQPKTRFPQYIKTF